jgi:hypothetical protein
MAERPPMIACFVLVLVGAAAYGFVGNPKGAELGRIAFFVGLFWLAYLLAQGRAFHLG